MLNAIFGYEERSNKIGKLHIEELGNYEICKRYKSIDQNKAMKWAQRELRRREMRNGA
jgi:hypothetical protein